MQGWKILKISTCTTCPCVCKFNRLHWKQSKFLLVLQHKVLAIVSGRVDFSSSEKVGSKNVPTIWVNTQKLNYGQEAAKTFIPFRPMEFSINFDTVKSGWSIIYIKGTLVTISPKKLYIIFFLYKDQFCLCTQWRP